MRYQLVLQWPASSIKSYDEMIWIEDALVREIGTAAEIDGHDAGAGEVNIFLFTDDPIRAFRDVQHVLGSKDFMIGLRAAFRERAGSDYQPIWPPGLDSFAVA